MYQPGSSQETELREYFIEYKIANQVTKRVNKELYGTMKVENTTTTKPTTCRARGTKNGV